MLVFLQFTIILDFMILSPLGAILLEKLGASAAQFSTVVSAYAFAAGVSGLCAAGFADRFDRKKLLLFFYAGFVLGTLLCGIAWSYSVLLFARIVTGLFGGVIGAVVMAIIADLFPFAQRGRVMGFVQTAFAASQVLGLPLGVYLAGIWGWHAPFLIIAGIAALAGVVIALKLKPVDAHLRSGGAERDPFKHLWKTATHPRYRVGFAAAILLPTGGFMLMPFGSAFAVHNLGIPFEQLSSVYLATGLCTLVLGPLIGRLSDRFGKYNTFCVASVMSMLLVLYYTRLGTTPLSIVMALNSLLFVAITGRIVSATALTTAIPNLPDRGAYMSTSASLTQFAGGLSALAAGHIVTQNASGAMEHYPRLGVVVAVAIVLTMLLMYRVHRLVTEKPVGLRPQVKAA